MQLNKAKTIQLDYQNLCHWRTQEQTAKIKLQKLSDNLTDLELKANQAIETAQNQQTKYDDFIKSYENEIEKINQAMVHDQAIESFGKQITKEKKLQLESEKSLTEFQLQLKNVQNALTNLEKGHQHNQHYIEEHQSDVSLAIEIEGIEYQITALQSQEKAYQKQLADVQKLNQNIDTLSKQIDDQKSNISTQASKINQLVKDIDGLNKKANNELSGQTLEHLEERLEHKQTELQLRQKIISLENERERLSDGSPCPLCGALDHPYAQGNVPEVDNLQMKCNEIKKTIKVVRQYQKNLTQKEKELTQEKQALQKLENNIELLLKEKEHYQEQLAELSLIHI